MSWFKKNQEVEETKKTALATVLFVIFVATMLITLPLVVYQFYFAGKIYQGVLVGEISVGNMTSLQAEEKIKKAITDYNDNGFQFIAKNKTVSIKPSSVAVGDPDLTYDLVKFNINILINEAYSFGRSGDLAVDIINQAKAILSGYSIENKFEINKEKMIDALEANFSELETPFQPPSLVFEGEVIKVTQERVGMVLNYDKAIEDLKFQISSFEHRPINIDEEIKIPEYTKADVESRLPLIEKVIKEQKISFTKGDKTWEVPLTELKKWLLFRKDNDQLILTLDKELVSQFIAKVASEIDVAPKDAVIEFSEDKTKVIKFTPHIPGEKVDQAKALGEIVTAFEDGTNYEDNVILEVAVADASVQVKDLNELGIKEIIAVGESNYSGSPKNRRHNIATGARSFNGVLLAPGEEFSALKFIGEVDASTGYLPELVIKGNETKPEYGGGLCQVSTTMFRAALNAGLEITRRVNHSYTVSYYSPIGTDATIYDPAPDFRFKNDTSHHILVHTVNDAENSKLYFEIWGTKDGRIVEMTKPVTYDWIKPPPTKIIETLTLKPGEKRCTEKPHSGVKAYFDQIITLTDGTKKEKRFNSEYRPWQEVCLVGVEKLSTEAPVDPTTPLSPEVPVTESPTTPTEPTPTQSTF